MLHIRFRNWLDATFNRGIPNEEEWQCTLQGNVLFTYQHQVLFFPIIYSPSHEEDHGHVPTSSEEVGEEDGDNDPDRFSPEAHSSPEQ